MNNITAYPLAWPPSIQRTPRREPTRFRTTLTSALGNVQTSLIRFAKDSEMGLEDLVISSNVTLGVHRPRDPGVAIWFVWDLHQVCIPNDKYSTVEGNLQGIHHIIEARRVELRHGSLELVRATFKGFMLAAPTNRPWFRVLGVKENDPPEKIKAAYQKLRSAHHPDREGGDHLTMTDINAAWEQAQWIMEPETEGQQ
jgi:hypothetical protein